MIYMNSQAQQDGTLQLTVTFKLGTDIDRAQVQVQNRVAQALPRLPEEVRAAGVTTRKSSPNLTMVVHLYSPDGRSDGLYLRNLARSEEHTSELQSLMRISYAVFCLKTKIQTN